jgi:hypothetical protein
MLHKNIQWHRYFFLPYITTHFFSFFLLMQWMTIKLKQNFSWTVMYVIAFARYWTQIFNELSLKWIIQKNLYSIFNWNFLTKFYLYCGRTNYWLSYHVSFPLIKKNDCGHKSSLSDKLLYPTTYQKSTLNH